ncbi:DUF4355 domain-containing protein [Loigolactobacillus backii]|uniref:DUF4355 domain-containing protein n=1 Tax=Loigolactobacillus backii TaxID=375175 RepID=UPI0007F0AAA8|nr:DUF4355 domain-containing protein [Loigolactobacillus backii]ANK59821.1 hypothetical protein AYR52_05830 [Loigolactobacillus backii]
MKQLMKMNLQFFAEDNGSNGAEVPAQPAVEEAKGNDTAQTNNTDSGQQSSVTFTDGQQAKVDEIIKSRLSKAQEKWQQSTNDQINSAIADYQKKANMTPEQQAAAEQSDSAKQVAQLQSQLDHRDRLDHAKQVAADKTLPTSFAEWAVAGSDADTDSRLDEIGKEFNKSVQAAVEERLKGKQTPGAGGGSKAVTKGAYGEKLANEFAPTKPKSSYFNK